MVAKKTKAAPRKRAPKAKRTAKRKHVQSLGVDAGAIGTAAAVALSPSSKIAHSPAWHAKVIATKTGTASYNYDLGVGALKKNLTNLMNYVPLGVGIAASAAPRLPIIKHFAKPVDNAIKAFTRGKWRL